MSPVFRSLVTVVSLSAAACAAAADGFDLPPIEYSTAEPANIIHDLQSRLDSGQATLISEQRTGFLKSTLKALKVPVESQVLVFSQTSLQRHLITPETPRAIYFNDDVYVGICQGGEVLEISVADSKLGTVFYTLRQKETATPKFIRQTDNCLQCHQSSRTEGVPGHLVRSLFVGKSGVPIYSGGSYTVDHTTPFENRWGGWYVTGSHGSQKHLGNLILEGGEVPDVVDNSAGQNQSRLPSRVDPDEYLTPNSDIVALMVLEHQALVHNRITKANFATRQALTADGEMKKILGQAGPELLDSTRRRIEHAGEDLIEAILFVGEAPLTAPVKGTSGYAAVFEEMGPRDPRGRSLRDFDLQTRMFRYPCSYLIGSTSFLNLPDEMKAFVWKRLHAILAEGADAKKYAHLSADDRQAILEIITATQPDLPAEWK